MQTNTSAKHIESFITAASTVFLHDWCNMFVRYQLLVEDADMHMAARACAVMMLRSDKCRELERMVEEVIQHPVGMPDMEDSELFKEVMAAYSGVSQASGSGASMAEFRRSALVPAIVQSAMGQTAHDEARDEQEQAAFLEEVHDNANHWQHYTPVTPFQHIVCRAINTMSPE